MHKEWDKSVLIFLITEWLTYNTTCAHTSIICPHIHNLFELACVSPGLKWYSVMLNN